MSKSYRKQTARTKTLNYKSGAVKALAITSAVAAMGALTVATVAVPASAVASSVAVNGGVLRIVANDTDSNIRVRHSGASTLVSQVGLDQTWTFPTGNITKVDFTGGSGHDTFNASGLNHPVLARGNNGNDVLTGGNMRDTLVGGGGSDQLVGGNEDDTIVLIDGAGWDTGTGGNGKDTFWRDSGQGGTDTAAVSVADYDNQVRSFTNEGTDRTLNGDAIPDPAAPAGMSWRAHPNQPLFSTAGPSGTDIRQGGINDCKVVSALSALAHNTRGGSAWPVRRAMADFGDGTFGVRLGTSFYRVDNDLLHNNGGGQTQVSSGSGAQQAMWVGIAEKAIAIHDRQVRNAPYLRLQSTSPATVFAGFGSASTGTPRIREFAANAQQLGNRLFARWNGYENVTLSLDRISTANGVHAYTVWNVRRNNAGVVTSIQLRNPWGTRDGGANNYRDANPNDAFVTVTPARLYGDRGGRVNWGSAI